MTKRIDFQTDPSRYRHWRVAYDGDTATLYMDVAEKGGLFEGYGLKLNSYDLGVDIELADVVQRMRFEHPEVKAVVLRSGKDNVFCAGANIRMLASASHAHKVNFCKFTNETRNTFETAGAESGQYYICAIKGACAGGGYELALACDHIILTDDGSSNVALPEVPLARGAAGHGRPHARHRQAESAPRPRRRILLDRGRRERQARGRVAACRRGGAKLEVQRDRREPGEELRGESGSEKRARHLAHAAGQSLRGRRLRHLLHR